MTDRIEINPSVMQGKPVIRGTRIPVELLLRKLARGWRSHECETRPSHAPCVRAPGAATALYYYFNDP
jgi:hypothetical protein